MFRPVARTVARKASSNGVFASAVKTPTRRWASTGADKPRSWKSGIARWGLAGAAVYYYNTSSVFAEEGDQQYVHHPPPASSDTEEYRTLESYAKKPAPAPTLSNAQTTEMPIAGEAGAAPSPVPQGGASDLEAEASQQGAFNEETGEINWDCPCLGGMAHGPCGEEFRAAFSCFVYSKEEPKGVDCIEKFKGMQDCFRAHPDIYGAELEDDEAEGVDGALPEGEGAPALARDAGSLEQAGEVAEDAAVSVASDVDAKVASVRDDIEADASKVKAKVEDKLQETRTKAVETEEKAREVARESVSPEAKKTSAS